MERQGELSFIIRTYRACDQQVCKRLFVEGLVGGKIADGDTGADIDCIESHYLGKAGSHFWVAELRTSNGHTESTIVGMIGVQQRGDGTAEIRRLRVDEAFRRRGIGSSLMETAIRFCHEEGHLRIILDTFMERDPAVGLFQKFHFQHGRTRRVQEKDLLYFYLDLYGGTSSNQ